MARTLEDIARETLGAQAFLILTLQHRVETLEEQVGQQTPPAPPGPPLPFPQPAPALEP